MRRAARLGENLAKPPVAGTRLSYSSTSSPRYYDHDLAEAVVSVLQEGRGQRLRAAPPTQLKRGMAAMIVCGDVDAARDQALANLQVLANAVRDGFTVVCSRADCRSHATRGIRQS